MRKVKVSQYEKNGGYVAEYESILDAANAVNGQPQHISECMRGIPHRHTHKGYEWRKCNGQYITMGKTKNKEDT